MHLFSDVYVYLDFFVFVVHSIGVSCPLKDNISANQFFRRAQRTPAGNIEFPLTVYRQTFTCEILLAYRMFNFGLTESEQTISAMKRCFKQKK